MKGGYFHIHVKKIARHLDSLIREHTDIYMDLYSLQLLGKPPSLKAKVKMSKNVTSFKLMIYILTVS